jgi:hypothetical protein
MDTQTLTQFFLWCTVVNGAVLLLWSTACMAAPDLVYRTQARWFPVPRPTFDVMIYAFLGLFKIMFLFFNAVPYVALRIMGSG